MRWGERQHDGKWHRECPCRIDAGLEVLRRSSVRVDPSEKALDAPSTWQYGKTDLIGAFGDDLDDNVGRSSDTLAGYLLSVKTLSVKGNEWRETCNSGPPDLPLNFYPAAIGASASAIAILKAGRISVEHESEAVIKYVSATILQIL